nr:MAG TPA: hypothetical protein [Caudoviricetes sp.]
MSEMTYSGPFDSNTGTYRHNKETYQKDVTDKQH